MADAERRGNALGTRYVERFLRNLFNPQGPSNYSQWLRGDISPSVEVRPVHAWDFRDFGIIPWALRVVQTAVAAQNSYLQLQPVFTDYDVVVLRFKAEQTTTYIRLNQATQGGALTQVSTFSRDSGIGSAYGAALTAAWANQSTNAGLVGAIVQFCPNGVETEFPVILRSNATATFLTVANETVNQQMACSVWGFLVPVNVGLV